MVATDARGIREIPGMTNVRPRNVKTIVALASAAITAAVSLLVAEGALRYRERHRAVPRTMPLIYYQHERLHHALVRNMDYFGRAHINQYGFRGGGPLEVAKQAGKLRIMAIGGSTTFDTQATDDDHTWPARLEFWLGKLGASPVEVINAGVPGYTTLDSLIRLQAELYRFQPDILIVYEGHNDLFHALNPDQEATADPRTPGEVKPLTPWSHWLKRHSLFYAKLLEHLQVVHFAAMSEVRRESSLAEDDWSRRIDEGDRQFAHDFVSLLMLARRFSPHVVVPELVQVSGVNVGAESDPDLRTMWESTMRAPANVVLRAYARYNATLADVARRFGATLIVTEPFGLTGAAWYAERDPIHFNDQGSDRMALKMAESLISSGLVVAR